MKNLFTVIVLLFALLGQLSAQVNNNESFDGTTFPPSGWTNSAVVGTMTWARVTSSTYPTGTTPHSGAGMTQYDAYNSNGSGDAAFLSTPSYSLANRGSNTPTVSFWMNRHAYSSQTPSSALDVYVNTTNSLTGATLLGTIYSRYDQAPVVASAGWYQYSYNIPSGFNTSTNYIIFKATSDYWNNIQIDDITYVSYPSGPLPPATFSASAISGSQINLSFTTNASNDSIVISYNTTGTFSTPSGAPPIAGNAFAGGTLLYKGKTSPVNHTGLNSSTKYYYAAWSYDGTNYTLSPSTANATTAYGIPFSEGFEGITVANQMPAGWNYSADVRTYLTAQGSYNRTPHSGSKFASFYYYPGGTGYIMTPGIYLSSGITYEFGYWYITDSYAGWYSLQTYYGTTANLASMTSITSSLISNPTNTTYLQSFSSFQVPTSGVYYFAIACNHSTGPWYLTIDDIILQQAANMNVVSATTIQNSNIVAPKTSKQQVVAVKVVTNNAANALKVTEMQFSTTGTSNTLEIMNAKAYYTGNTATFDTTTRFGGNVSSPGASFSLTGNQTLVRGDNYFWLVYDIAPCATVGNLVDAECTLFKYDSLTTIKSFTPGVTAPTGSRQIQTSIMESFTAPVALANGWTTSLISGSQNFMRVTSGSYPTNPPYSLPGMVQYNAYATSAGSQAEMYSPSVDWSSKGTSTPQVSFKMYRHNYWSTSSSVLDVYVNTIPSTTGATLLRTINTYYLSSPVEPSIGWYTYTSNIPASYSGTQNYIIFKATGDYWNNIQIDEIAISQYPINPLADFSIPDTTCIGTPFAAVNASSGANYFSWFYNNIFKNHNTNLAIVATNLGYDTITLISESQFCSDTITKKVFIENPSQSPVTDFIADKNLIEEGEIVQFTDLSAFCPSGWTWNITPDTIIDPVLGPSPAYEYTGGTSMFSQNPMVIFYYGGTYSVSMTSDNSISTGSTKTKQNYIIVKASATMCLGNNFSKLGYGNIYDDGGSLGNYSPNLSCAYLIDLCASKTTLTFTDFEFLSGDSLRIYDGNSNKGTKLWNTTLFPNGLTGNISSPNFVKTYVANTGKIYVEFKSDGSNQGRGFKANWTSIPGFSARPTASYTSDDTVCVGIPFALINNSVGADLAYQWDINNDGISDEFVKDLSLTFPTPGSYPVTLIVNDCGGYDTFTKTIVAMNPSALPAMDFVASNLFPRKQKDVVSFTDLSKNCPLKKTWIFTPNTVIFQNGTHKNSDVPVVKFQDTGYYTIELIDSNVIGNNNLVKAGYIHVIEYCNPSVATKLQDIGISRVILNNVDNSSNCGIDAYTDYSNTLPAIKLEAGATYNITVERNTFSNAMTRKVWIDYNMNGNFNDAGELVAFEAAANTQRWIGTFKVPATVANGFSLLRIGTSYDQHTNTPCGPNQYGEFEDYKIEFSQDFTIPVITLLGPDTIILGQCSNYSDSGATAWDNVAGDITSMIVTTNDLNVALAGNYKYRYNVSDLNGNKAEEVIRNIIVQQDTRGPLLTLNGKTVDTIMVFDSFVDPGYSANTLCIPFSHVSISGKVDTSRTGKYLITYTAYDVAGNTSAQTRTVYVIDTVSPAISLIGPKTFVIGVFNTFIDPGSLVTDNYDTTLKVKVSGFVNTTLLGTYYLTYSCTDGSGNSAVPVSRRIDVVDTLPPVITTYSYNNGDTIVLEVFDKFSMPYTSQTDNYYRTLTTSVSGSFYSNFPNGVAKTLGYYNVVFIVSDGSNNSDSILYVVYVVDTEKPVISLTGDPIVNLCRYDMLPNDDVNISDNYYKNLTATKGGTYYTDYVVHALPGSYFITYNVTDGSGNVADQVYRYVYVKECENAINNNDDLKVEVYPNPSHGIVNVEFSLSQYDDVTISVVNSLGETVKVVKGNNVITHIYTLDLSMLNDGLYFVKVETSKLNTVYPVVLAR